VSGGQNELGRKLDLALLTFTTHGTALITARATRRAKQVPGLRSAAGTRSGLQVWVTSRTSLMPGRPICSGR
jgi:hypothetical protein